MSRSYADPVEVRRRDDAPAEFLWRGRLYVVRDVLAHWVETRAWWVRPAAVTVGTGTPVATCEEDAEQEVWRVEASPGRVHGSGVYDLRFDWASGRWALARVID